MHPKVAEVNHLSLVSPIQLDRTDQVMGTVFRKQIMSYGRWVNPNWWWDEELWMELDESIADEMIDNFNKKTFGKRISVPLNHTGDVTANAGEVIKLEKGTGGLWAYIDIRRPDTVADIDNGLVFDVSMGFDLDYVDQKDGLHHGAVLIHVALVTDPYLNDMEDFQHATDTELSKRYDEWAGNIGFGKTQPSLIMMSKYNVEEMKRMKFAKVTNDKEHAVEVTYTDADGSEVKKTVSAGATIDVPTEAEEAVKTQVSESVAPVDPAEPTDPAPADPVVDPAEPVDPAPADPAPAPADEDEKQELARVRRENAELKTNQEYARLLSAGKISPAQEAMFKEFALSGSGAKITFAKDYKGSDGKVMFAKGSTTSVLTMLSAILEAGPKVLSFKEQGGQGGKGGATAELTKEQEAKIKKYGFSVEKFKKQLAAGTITMEDIE